MAGRIVVDIGLPESSPETWAGTQDTALLRIGKAMRETRLSGSPMPVGGRVEVERKNPTGAEYRQPTAARHEQW
jgi:hypothetical protein